MEAVKTMAFWEDLNGRVACEKHIGNEAKFVLDIRKKAKTITTSMTKWYKMSQAEVTEFAELVGHDKSICESCRYGA
jgi:hypothetical protein